jgi:hypothetical protein
MRAALLVATLLVGAAACAGSSNGETPAADAQGGFPDLRSVPQGSDANTDAAYWARIEADLIAAGSEMRAHPRAQPATESENPSAFLDEARRELEESRQSHEPN